MRCFTSEIMNEDNNNNNNNNNIIIIIIITFTYGNGNPMKTGIRLQLGNENGKEWE